MYCWKNYIKIKKTFNNLNALLFKHILYKMILIFLEIYYEVYYIIMISILKIIFFEDNILLYIILLYVFFHIV